MNIMVNIQDWINQKYPNNKAGIRELYLNEPNLEGELELKDFSKLEKILISYFLDESKIALKNKLETIKIIKLINAQQYLDKNYPLSQRKTIEKLDLVDKDLNGSLVFDGSEWTSLVEINVEFNKLTSLTITNCQQLTRFDCAGNHLTNLILTNCPNLTEIKAYYNKLTDLNVFSQLVNCQELDISDNHFTSDLASLKNLTNLRELQISDNQISSSLASLKNMTKLEKVDIANTNLTGLECLPESLEKIWSHENQYPELEEYVKYDVESGWEYCDYQLWRKNWEREQQIILLQQERSRSSFTNQKEKIDYLQARINELTNLIKTQKEKIINIFLRLSPEKELVQELITIHLEATRYKKQAIDSEDYDEISEEYEDKCKDIKKELRTKLDKDTMNKIRGILTDCEEIVSQELELETKLNDKSRLIETHKQTANQIQGTEVAKIIESEEQINHQQIQLAKEVTAINIFINNNNTSSSNNANTINDNSRIYDNARHNEHHQSQFHQEVPPKSPR